MIFVYMCLLSAVIVPVVIISAAYFGEMIYNKKDKPMDIFNDDSVVVEPVPQSVIQPIEQPRDENLVDINTLTMIQLKAYAKRNNIKYSTTDRKADIIQKIKEAMTHNA